MDTQNARDVRAEGDVYPVVEIFNGIQFEGARSGTQNIFLRLAGCNLHCPFCDTDLEKWRWMGVGEIIQEMKAAGTSNTVVITGGEPMVHNLYPLILALRACDYHICMESNGSLLQEYFEQHEKLLLEIEWLTVSPKSHISTHLLINYAAEVKYVVPDHEKLISWGHRRVFLQPEWNNPRALERCLALLEEHASTSPRLSIQTHKYLGLR